MIGSLSYPVYVNTIMSDPPGMVTSPFFKYTGNYSVPDRLQPGYGYWVKVNQSGKLNLSSMALISETSLIKIMASDDELTTQPPDEIEGSSSIPRAYSLSQNYPNPFNPVTIFTYQLPVDSSVTLKIYNMLGQTVTILLVDIQEAGYRFVKWNASNAASGIYLYHLDAKSVNNPSSHFTQARKMLLLR